MKVTKSKYYTSQKSHRHEVAIFYYCPEGDSRNNYHMRKTDARTVCSSRSLSIANDGAEPQFCRIKVPITLLFVDETIKSGYSFS